MPNSGNNKVAVALASVLGATFASDPSIAGSVTAAAAAAAPSTPVVVAATPPVTDPHLSTSSHLDHPDLLALGTATTAARSKTPVAMAGAGAGAGAAAGKVSFNLPASRPSSSASSGALSLQSAAADHSQVSELSTDPQHSDTAAVVAHIPRPPPPTNTVPSDAMSAAALQTRGRTGSRLRGPQPLRGKTPTGMSTRLPGSLGAAAAAFGAGVPGSGGGGSVSGQPGGGGSMSGIWAALAAHGSTGGGTGGGGGSAVGGSRELAARTRTPSWTTPGGGGRVGGGGPISRGTSLLEVDVSGGTSTSIHHDHVPGTSFSGASSSDHDDEGGPSTTTHALPPLIPSSRISTTAPSLTDRARAARHELAHLHAAAAAAVDETRRAEVRHREAEAARSRAERDAEGVQRRIDAVLAKRAELEVLLEQLRAENDDLEVQVSESASWLNANQVAVSAIVTQSPAVMAVPSSTSLTPIVTTTTS